VPVLHAVGLLTAHLAKVRGAKQIISIDCVDYRLDRVKQASVETPSFHTAATLHGSNTSWLAVAFTHACRPAANREPLS
jgi:threonine dehydrogenase-like Zn-dependent dehydrogenase